MRVFYAALALAALLAQPAVYAQAQQKCIPVAQIEKWEVIKYDKLLAYRDGRYFAFLNLSSVSMLRPSGPLNLRFFTNNICAGDTMMANGAEFYIRTIELIRQD